jgi:hypothetical protein
MADKYHREGKLQISNGKIQPPRKNPADRTSAGFIPVPLALIGRVNFAFIQGGGGGDGL